MAMRREPNLVLAMENKNERFPLYPMEPSSPQDDSGAPVKVAATRSCASSQRASKLSAEVRSSIQRAVLKIVVWLHESIGIGIQTKSAEGAN